jgi:hypothetical protein
MQFDLYRPELHYMRGPGPKWHAKQDLAFAPLDGAIGGLRWANTTVAAVCAGVLSVVFLLTIATSLIASSSSSANAEPPGKGCVAVSTGEYQVAYRKKLLLSRFGTYVRTGRLGQYYYWYCH